MKRYIVPITLLTSLFAISVGANLKQSGQIEAKAVEELSLQSGGDAFKLLDKQFGVDESFVYTADLHFKSGQAGGLAFGSEEGDHYYVINMDRFENRVKLLYFSSNGAGGYSANELRNDYFIGNDKMTSQEFSMVQPQVAGIENVNLKVILTKEDEHAYVELYVEGIKRFGVDATIDLNDLGTSYKYQGGYLGMNCFNGDVYLENIEIGKSDYSYFSEPYRNQYHLQPFAKWSNDPNALCYYNGYYHVFYQTHPFGLDWGSMYWGHARSKDLIHFEFLPICLFPEREGMGFGPGDAYMWSGCAISYKHGMSADIDLQNWFPNGGGNGILAIYTRDGGLQDQIVISSDDEGLTWTKRHRIPQTLTGYTNKIDWRDPKVFPLKKDSTGAVQIWGMTLSSYALNKGWFLRSMNLLDWSIAGEFALPTPECIGVGFIKDNLGEEHAYLTNKSRTYILGDLVYNDMDMSVKFYDENHVDISTYSLEQMNSILKPLDFGPDSYASQSFYISDPLSEFYDKDIVLNWFSGDLNASFCTGPGEYKGLRGRWNGGFTIPVEYGVLKTNDEYRITQKPITVNNTNLEKTNLIDISNQDINLESDNPLKDIHTHAFELTASIDVTDNSPITFRVDVGDDEYMQFGWNVTDGYYVDRTHLDDKGINTNIDWHVKYASHILGDTNTKTFYVLSDNNGLEVFCEDYSISFYFVTTASIYSTGALLKADNAHINRLEINEVASIYRKGVSVDEGVLYVSSNDVYLDSKFLNSKFITCWFSGSEDLTWELLEGEDVVSYQTSNQGVNFTVLKDGTAKMKVSAGNQEQIINITVYASSFESDLSFDKNDIVSGQWIMGEGVIIGEKSSGNGFILAEQVGSDFTYTGQFDILSGTAASLVFRASSDMSSYLVANYDAGEGIVKLWSTHGELTRSGHLDIGLTDIILSVKANEKDIIVTINGNVVISYTLKDNEPLSGHFGLNVFSGKARFKSLSIAKENYEYASGSLQVDLPIDQFIVSVYNVTLGNVLVDSDFYYQADGTLYIREEYFNLLSEDGRYQFRVVGASYTFTINVDVVITHTFDVENIVVETGNTVSVYVGINNITSVNINGEDIAANKYHIKDYVLYIENDCFKEGENEVILNGSVNFAVTMNSVEDTIVHPYTKIDYTPIIVGGIIGASVLLIAGVTVTIILVSKKRRK